MVDSSSAPGMASRSHVPPLFSVKKGKEISFGKKKQKRKGGGERTAAPSSDGRDGVLTRTRPGALAAPAGLSTMPRPCAALAVTEAIAILCKSRARLRNRRVRVAGTGHAAAAAVSHALGEPAHAGRCGDAVLVLPARYRSIPVSLTSDRWTLLVLTVPFINTSCRRFSLSPSQNYPQRLRPWRLVSIRAPSLSFSRPRRRAGCSRGHGRRSCHRRRFVRAWPGRCARSWHGLGGVAGAPTPPEAVAPSLLRRAARGRPDCSVLCSSRGL